MIRKTVFSALAILFLMGMVNGQVTQPGTAQLNELEFFIQLNNPKYDGVEGSKYLFEEFVPAKINTIQKSYLVRFDILENTIEVKKDKDEIIGLSKKTDYTIKLLDGSERIFETKTFSDKNGYSVKGIFEQLYADDFFILFGKSRIKFQKAKPMKSSYEQAVPAKFVPLADAFYVFFLKGEKSGKMVRIPQKKKELKSFFGTEASKMEKFMKQEKLTFDSREDLIQTLKFYSSLIKL
ncbi:hypothetical protein KIM67_04565 [Flagellimonas sp. 389]|uniref:hypothetical protein n=1 Tax=Flagellimonas sp. 389 TaxID=2835862 RepID=UPI001BD1CBCC|nr:hypothetical protein [Flagellimonas sp. 389]MBS9461671.1 hypothetical protein [Flagellimonas sp. 389]